MAGPSATSSLRIEKQFTGENINLWGDHLNTNFDLLDSAIAGFTSVSVAANVNLTSANYVADEARSAMLKFTGAGGFSVTIPSVSKQYLVWNACTDVVTITTGSGASVAVPAGAIQAVLCDGTNVKEPGYAGYGMKDYIDQAIIAVTGSLPAVTGNAGKYLYCDGSTWLPRTPVASDLSDYNTNVKGLALAFAVAL